MTPAQLEKKIRSWSDIWQERMRLEHYEIRHKFLDEYCDEDDGGNGSKVLAVTKAGFEYLEATVIWYVPPCLKWDDESLEKSLVHELCHVLLASEQSVITKPTDHHKLELATEMTCRALWKAYHQKKGS